MANVRVSTYVGGVHEDLMSLAPNPGGVDEVALSRSKGTEGLQEKRSLFGGRGVQTPRHTPPGPINGLGARFGQ